MKKTLIILTSFVLISCSSSENHADYEKNLEIAKKFLSVFIPLRIGKHKGRTYTR